jgi:hypothetical protein
MSDPTPLGEGEEDTLISQRPKAAEAFDEAQTLLSVKAPSLDARFSTPSVVVTEQKADDSPPPQKPEMHVVLAVPKKPSGLVIGLAIAGVIAGVVGGLWFLGKI